MPETGQYFSCFRGDRLRATIGPFRDEDGSPVTLTAGRVTLAAHPNGRRVIRTWRTPSDEVSLTTLEDTDDSLEVILTGRHTRGLAPGRYYLMGRGLPDSGSQIGATAVLEILEAADADESPLV